MIAAGCGNQSNLNRNILRLLCIVLVCSLITVFKESQDISDSFTNANSVSERSSAKNVTAETVPSNKTPNTAISPNTTAGSISSSSNGTTGATASPNKTTGALAPSNSLADAATGSPNDITELDFPERWGPCDPRQIESYLPQGKVWIVSFAGWQQKRVNNARAVQRSVTGWLDGKVHPLLYTENDLPPSYYERFNWSFAKPGYRGFWTWKPWILRNLTETAVFKAGDVVLWIDSDRKLTSDKRHLRTALCNMEHRNRNYAGVFPFRRCYHNLENRNTKPETFDRMGLNRTEWGQGEQIYAGSIGFRINQDTHAFLKEWEDWGMVPVMFGNDKDFPSNPPPPGVYRRHKNDQSVFSLMCRTRNMKAWPAPYYDRKRSGINRNCHKDFQDAGYCFFFDNKANIPEVCKPLEEWMQNLPPS